MGAAASIPLEKTELMALNRGPQGPIDFFMALDSNRTFLGARLPSKFLMHVSYESLEIRGASPPHDLIMNILYTDIDSWQSSSDSITLNLNARAIQTASGTNALPPSQHEHNVHLMCPGRGRHIATLLLETIRDLMVRMRDDGYTVEAFQAKLPAFFDENMRRRPDWKKILGTERKLTSFQILMILDRFHFEDTFEKLDVLCYLYELLLNKASFQLVMNHTSDPVERENLIHRLNLYKPTTVERSLGGVPLSTTALTLKSSPPHSMFPPPLSQQQQAPHGSATGFDNGARYPPAYGSSPSLGFTDASSTSYSGAQPQVQQQQRDEASPRRDSNSNLPGSARRGSGGEASGAPNESPRGVQTDSGARSFQQLSSGALGTGRRVVEASTNATVSSDADLEQRLPVTDDELDDSVGHTASNSGASSPGVASGSAELYGNTPSIHLRRRDLS